MDIDETAVSENGRRKYQVFISSTFRDLGDQRRMVLDVVIDRGHMPIALERFPAADRTVPNVIRKTIDASQIYVVILGYRYGAIVDGEDISFSQLEYEIAVEQGKIVTPFLLVDDEVREQRSALEARLNELKTEISQLKASSRLHRELKEEIDSLTSELEHDPLLSEFRKKVSQGRFCKPFSLKNDRTDYGSGADRFERHMVLKALIEAEEDADKKRVAGWIREPDDKTLSDTLAAVSGNRFLVDVVASMAKFDRLGPRIRDQADEKEAAARFFADKYLQPLLSKEARLFFESGSSIAYVAQVVGKRLEDHRKEIVISTNNVLAYLIFWLVHRVRCSMFPWGPPEERYGAVFGPVNEHVPETMQPSFPPEELSVDDMEAIRLLHEDPYSPASWHGPALMLGALSGLQLTLDPEIANCCGPHVGSPRNKVFKRFMYSTDLPLMLFMTANKVDCPVDHEHCHFILEQGDGAGLPWRNFVSARPIAFCVGCKNDTDEIDRIVKQFESYDLLVVRARHKTPHTAFVARNQKFIDVVESGMTIRS